ncbi:RNA-directed DNA polymerase from transposon X-element, partial [Paramuricea clavata]
FPCSFQKSTPTLTDISLAQPLPSAQMTVHPKKNAQKSSKSPKIDEIQHCVVHANFGLVCLTETWLKDCIQDEVVSISGFNIVRLDRKSQVHGGVCT